MNTLLLENYPATESLVREVYKSDLPVVVSDGQSECMVAMTPQAFEQILFDTALLNLTDRKTLRL